MKYPTADDVRILSHQSICGSEHLVSDTLLHGVEMRRAINQAGGAMSTAAASHGLSATTIKVSACPHATNACHELSKVRDN